MILVCGGIKGGTGKTTLATNLAVLRACHGRVLLVDADEQQSASDWAEMRQNADLNELTTVSLFGKNIDKQVLRMLNDYDDIIIDVGGRDTTSQRSALIIANVLLIPYKPRSLDIWTISKVKSLISDCQIANSGLLSYFLINQADAVGSDNKAAMDILSEQSGIKKIPFMIGNRKCFCHAASEGLAIMELKKKDRIAIEELIKVHDMIYM